jgi:hypothetical protein
MVARKPVCATLAETASLGLHQVGGMVHMDIEYWLKAVLIAVYAAEIALALVNHR